MNIAVAQSGGPTCAINASLAGVFNAAFDSDKIEKIYGSANGIEGILNNELIDLCQILKTHADRELLKTTPSTVLGSCRFRLPDIEDDLSVYEKITECFEKNNIGIFFYIGGNDSMDTVSKLSKYMERTGKDIKIMGIPKTIDNDLQYTDHTPGFGSAAKYLAVTMLEIIRDSAVYNLKSVTVVEVMGRHAGWLTASTCMLRANEETAPHLIYLPETDFNIDNFLNDIRELHKTYDSVIVAVSEGVTFNDKRFSLDSFQSGVTDAFGHQYLSGIGKCLENIIKQEIGCKVRSIELNVMQRCSSHLASQCDIDESEMIGADGVKYALEGVTGKMMIFKRVSDIPYKIETDYVDASLVANYEKLFPQEWINEAKNNITDEAIKYFLPLIQGDVVIKKKNGLPVHLKLNF
ncbi:MAG: 6-phosphofructokinase [Oscillospiraceae bacterium]